MSFVSVQSRPWVAAGTRSSRLLCRCHAHAPLPKGVRPFAAASGVNGNPPPVDGDNGKVLKLSLAAVAAASVFALGAPTFSAQAEAAPASVASTYVQESGKKNPAVGEVSLNLPGVVGRAALRYTQRTLNVGSPFLSPKVPRTQRDHRIAHYRVTLAKWSKGSA